MHLLRIDRVLPEAAGASPRFENDAIAGLAFETTEWQPVPWVLAHVVDVEGNRFEVGRKARVPGRCLHVLLFSELLAAGLRATRPLLVVVDRCPSLAARVRAAFGGRAHILDDTPGRARRRRTA